MNVDALPYTLLLILAQMTIGSLWLTLVADLRGGVTRGFVMTMAFCVAVAAFLTYWTATGLSLTGDVDGYRIDEGWFGPAKNALIVVIAGSAMYTFGAFMGWDPAGRIAAIVASIAGVVAVVAFAGMFAPPTWGYPAILVALLAGTLAMGAVTVAMVWGHWYLTEGALPAWPLRELALITIAVLLFQTLVVAVNLALPVRETPTPASPIDASLFANPAFYLRVGVGLIFPLILAVLAFSTTRIRAMQSATGLFYIAMGAVFAGEVLSKGLMFVTGKPI